MQVSTATIHGARERDKNPFGNCFQVYCREDISLLTAPNIECGSSLERGECGGGDGIGMESGGEQEREILWNSWRGRWISRTLLPLLGITTREACDPGNRRAAPRL